jgi:hypothetical protein
MAPQHYDFKQWGAFGKDKVGCQTRGEVEVEGKDCGAACLDAPHSRQTPVNFPVDRDGILQNNSTSILSSLTVCCLDLTFMIPETQLRPAILRVCPHSSFLSPQLTDKRAEPQD